MIAILPHLRTPNHAQVGLVYHRSGLERQPVFATPQKASCEKAQVLVDLREQQASRDRLATAGARQNRWEIGGICLSPLGCMDDSVADPGAAAVRDMAPELDLITQADLGSAPDLAPTVYRSCQETLQLGAKRADGRYSIDPDGPGGAPAFLVYCDMTEDGGGWTLLATLRTTNTYEARSSYAGWSDDWWAVDHGDAADPGQAFANHDARKFRPLVGPALVLRASSPGRTVKRFHFGFSTTNWDLWNRGRVVNTVSVVGPFNLTAVRVSASADLSGSQMAQLNGSWANGVFCLGTAPGAGDRDSEGIRARFHVGSQLPPQYGYAADVRGDMLWHLWLR